MTIYANENQYPEVKDGKAELDMTSGKYMKIWQGPQHPGITGNMSLELTVAGDEVYECKTHVGYLHRGFEKTHRAAVLHSEFPDCMPYLRSGARFQ